MRLWNSVENSLFTEGMEVSIHVMLDRADTNNDDVLYRGMESLVSKHGATYVHRAERHTGLKASVLSAWDARDESEYAVMLEDDIEVSPYFLLFAERAVRAYGIHDRLMGVSLFHLLWDEVNNAPAQFDTDLSPFLLQFPQSWGAIYFPRAWKKFVSWANAHVTDPLVPNSLYTNQWNASTSWKKYAIKYMHDHELSMVYTNFPNHRSLSVHHAERGTHFLTKPSARVLKQRWMPPLVYLEMDATPSAPRVPDYILNLPPMAELPEYNMYHRLIKMATVPPIGNVDKPHARI